MHADADSNSASMCGASIVTAVEHMAGPKIAWRVGRQDSDKPSPLPNGRLPNADMGCPAATNSHIRGDTCDVQRGEGSSAFLICSLYLTCRTDIFGRMGFEDREIVALSGAHSLGRCHLNASGYWGPWTNAETTFSNEYFRLLLEEKWTPKSTHEGQPWTGPLQYENPAGTLMMLPSDLWLLEDPHFRQYVELYARDEELFFKDFAAAFAKLLELGVHF